MRYYKELNEIEQRNAEELCLSCVYRYSNDDFNRRTAEKDAIYKQTEFYKNQLLYTLFITNENCEILTADYVNESSLKKITEIDKAHRQLAKKYLTCLEDSGAYPSLKAKDLEAEGKFLIEDKQVTAFKYSNNEIIIRYNLEYGKESAPIRITKGIF